MLSKKSIYTFAVLGMLGAVGIGNSLVSSIVAYADTPRGSGERAATAKGIKLLGAYARASLGNLKNSAAFMSVINHNNQADKLIGVKSTVAARTELHTHIKQGNIMKMRRIAAIDLPASGFVDLEPGGHHVMLIGLHKPLKAGDKFSLTLVFEKGGEQNVEVTVRGLGSKAAHRGSHDGRGSHEGGDMRGSHEGGMTPNKAGERGSH